MEIEKFVEVFCKYAKKKDTRVLSLRSYELYKNPENTKRLAKHMGIYNPELHDDNTHQLVRDVIKENERLKSEDLIESLDDKMKFYL